MVGAAWTAPGIEQATTTAAIRLRQRRAVAMEVGRVVPQGIAKATGILGLPCSSDAAARFAPRPVATALCSSNFEHQKLRTAADDAATRCWVRRALRGGWSAGAVERKRSAGQNDESDFPD